MTDNVAKLPNLNRVAVEAVVAPAALAQPQVETQMVDQPRLAIEQGPTGFVYKVLDRVTGEVIRQLPHQSVVKLAEDPAYDAGKVINTSA